MEPLTWGFIGILIGTVVGASASICTTYINARNSSEIQKNIEKYKRREIFREFQRDNYLKLQEAIPKLMRLVSLLYLEDIKNYRETEEWQKSQLNSDNDQNFMIALRDLSILQERVENDELREKLRNLRKKISAINNTTSQSESDEIMFTLVSNDIDQIMTNLGVELRRNY